MRRQNIFFAAAAVLLVIAGILFTYNRIIIPKVKQQTEAQIRMRYPAKRCCGTWLLWKTCAMENRSALAP